MSQYNSLGAISPKTPPTPVKEVSKEATCDDTNNVDSTNYYSPLAYKVSSKLFTKKVADMENPPPSIAHFKDECGRSVVMIPNTLQSVSEEDDGEGPWIEVIKRRHVKTKTHRREPFPVDKEFQEFFDTALEIHEKETRRTMQLGKRRRKLEPHFGLEDCKRVCHGLKIKLEPHAGLDDDFDPDRIPEIEEHGILESCKQVMSDVTIVKDNLDTVVQFARKLDELKNTLKFEGSEKSDLLENCVARIEGLGWYLMNLNSSQSWDSVLSATMLYIQTWYPKSVSLTLYGWIKTMLGFVGDKLENHGGTDEKPFDSFKGMLKDWRSFRNTELAQNLANVVDLLVTFSVLPASVKHTINPFRDQTFRAFKVRAWDIQNESIDFTMMVLDTLAFFLERGYAAFKTGDISALLYSDRDLNDFDLEYALLVSALPLLECGRLEELAKRMQENDIPGSKPIKDAGDFSRRTEALLANLASMIKLEKDERCKSALSQKYLTMSKVRTALTLAQRTAPLRPAPVAVLIYGKSSVMKSFLFQIIAKSLLSAMGYGNGPEDIVICNSSDPYMSEYSSDKNCVCFDDLMNQKLPPHMLPKDNPSRVLIEFINNITMAALDAAVENKGNKMILPKLVVVTTNRKDLNCNNLSVEGASILRRFDIVIDAELCPDFIDPETGGPDAEKLARVPEGEIPDAWNLLVETVKITRQGPRTPDSWSFESVFKKQVKDPNTGKLVAKPMRVGIIPALKHMITVAQNKQRHQKRYVDDALNAMKMQYCKHFLPPRNCPECRVTNFGVRCKECVVSDKHDYGCSGCKTLQFHQDVKPSDGLRTEGGFDEIFDPFSGVPPIPPMSGNMMKIIENFPKSRQEIVRVETIDSLESFEKSDEERNVEAREILRDFDCDLENDTDTFATTNDIPAELRIPVPVDAPKMTLIEIFKEKRSLALKALGAVGAAVSVGLAVYYTFKLFRTSVEPHGEMVSQPIQLDTDSAGVWKKKAEAKIPSSVEAKTTTLHDLLQKVRPHVYHVYVRNLTKDPQKEGIRPRCDIFPCRKDEWLIPTHMVEDVEAEYEIELTNHPKDTNGRHFKTQVCGKFLQPIPNTDYTIVKLLCAGSQPEFYKWFSEEEALVPRGATIPIHSLYRRADGELCEYHFRVHGVGEFETNRAYRAYEYYFSEETFRGLCMMPLITETRHPTILGFHLAGNGAQKYGVAGVITRSMYLENAEKLQTRFDIAAHSEGTFETEMYGIDYTPKPVSNPKHATNWMTECDDGNAPCVEIYGEHSMGTVSGKSNVRTSPISQYVEEEMSLPKETGAPDFRKTWKHYNRELHVIGAPRSTFNAATLDRAVEDMWQKVDGILDAKPHLLEMIHPIDLVSNLSGVDGINAVNAIDATTSAGFPINKPKGQFITPRDEDIMGISCPRDLDEMFINQMEKCEKILAEGRRCYFIHRANLKDEAVPYTKNKIRVFAGCPLHATLLTRKYLLGTIRAIQTGWLDFECAVGINAHGIEWDALVKEASKFGKDRMFAGDYKSFDKNISPTITMRAFEILIRMCKKAGYNKEQLEIIRGLATEICYPLMEYDGAFLQYFGSNPSGHALTVILNNICNSLYMRYVYYELHKLEENVPLFHTRVALICYGDDNNGSVSDEEELFHFESIQRILGEKGIVYTMADKSDGKYTLTTIDKISFLKRAMVILEELGVYVGRLEEASISKSLHNYMHRKKSVTLPEEIAGSAIFSALREYFRYGKDVFNLRRDQLRRVAERANILHFVPAWPTFEELVEEFNSDYVPPQVFGPLTIENHC